MRRTLNASIDEVYYLVSRSFATIMLIGLFLLMPEDLLVSRSMLGITAGASVIGSLLMVIATLRGRVTDAMMEVLVVDLIGLGALVYGLGDSVSQVYPLLAALPLLYGLTQPKSRAAIAAAAVAGVYVISQAPILMGDPRLARVVVVALGAAALVLISVLVTSAVERRRKGELAAGFATAHAEKMKGELEQRVAELQTIKRISEAVHSSLELDVMGPTVLRIIADWLNIETCSLFVIDRKTREPIITVDLGFAEDGPRASAPLDLPDTPSAEDVSGAFACLTIFESASLQVVLCAHPDSLTKVSENDRGMLRAACSDMVAAADNWRLYELSKRLAVTDELTGLYNYRHLQQALECEIERAHRYPAALSFVMLDIDDFKQFNDAYGHVAGDRVLGEIGQLLRGIVREMDIVARYGGEEFSVILPETSAHAAYSVAEKIRRAVERHTFTNAAGEAVGGLTVSVGLATFPTHAWDKEALLREADNALYHAKNGGKNRIRTPKTASIAGLADAISSACTEESELQ